MRKLSETTQKTNKQTTKQTCSATHTSRLVGPKPAPVQRALSEAVHEKRKDTDNFVR
jgi:hypothetical protein